GLTLIYADAKPIEFRYGLVEVGRGAMIGSIISLPFLFLARGVLSVTSARLFAIASFPALFQSLVLLAAPVEELFFRGFLQRERGLVMAAILYGLAGAVFFPTVSGRFPLVLAAVVGAMGLLGFIYGYVYNRYGLSASIACHAVVNLFLLFLPPLLDQLTL
ncbi:MAG: type II CAAX prenyl endopeptidase Rce1 family protein, partial [Anaerolineae bacterium]